MLPSSNPQVTRGAAEGVRSNGGAHKASLSHRGDTAALRQCGALVAALPASASAAIVSMFHGHGGLSPVRQVGHTASNRSPGRGGATATGTTSAAAIGCGAARECAANEQYAAQAQLLQQQQHVHSCQLPELVQAMDLAALAGAASKATARFTVAVEVKMPKSKKSIKILESS